MRTPLFVALTVLTSCSPLLTPVIERQSQPLVAQTRSARVIWLLDNSGSLAMWGDPPSAGCPAGCGPSTPCPTSCETLHDQLVAGLETLSAALPATTEHAAVFFPADAQCGAPSSIAEGLTATQVKAMAQASRPAGGTPTAAALQYVAALPASTVETFVVLITDGLPNCNAANPNNLCTNPTSETMAACRCTAATCWGVTCSIGCLDDLNTVNASHALAAQGLHLLVIGLGAGLATVASSSSLSALEMALPRTCVTATDCSVGSCEAGMCSERLFIATKAADYAAPAQRLTEAVKRAGRCSWWLPREVAASALTVSVSGEATTDWSLSGSGNQQRVVLTGAACMQLLADESLSPQFMWAP